jgi:predicted RNase H-like HicB family nuclease
VVRVSKLPEIATAGRSADEVHRLASDLRAAYLEALQ